MLLTQRANVALITSNAIGALLYDVQASHSWAIPQERAQGIYTITGEPIVWFLAILPILAVFFAVNFIWGALILRNRQWRSGRFWWGAALTWLIAVVIDFAHH